MTVALIAIGAYGFLVALSWGFSRTSANAGRRNALLLSEGNSNTTNGDPHKASERGRGVADHAEGNTHA